MSAVSIDDSVPSGFAGFDRIYGDKRRAMYQPVGTFGDVILQNAGSITVLPSSSAASSPWWLGQVMELETGGRIGALNDAVVVGEVVTKVLASRDGPWQAALIEPRQVVTAPLRQFGISLGTDIVTAIRGFGERTPALAAVHIPSAFGAKRTGLLGVARPTVVARPAVVVEEEEEEWDDSDEGPTWLAMDALPYRGGGVMARQRSHE